MSPYGLKLFWKSCTTAQGNEISQSIPCSNSLLAVIVTSLSKWLDWDLFNRCITSCPMWIFLNCHSAVLKHRSWTLSIRVFHNEVVIECNEHNRRDYSKPTNVLCFIKLLPCDARYHSQLKWHILIWNASNKTYNPH